MLQPEFLHSENLAHLAHYATDRATAQSVKSAAVAVEPAERDALLEALIPVGISPAKQAVVEQLISLWRSKAKLDVA